jgi:hypothetical protein
MDNGFEVLIKAIEYEEYIEKLNKKCEFLEMKKLLDYRISILDKKFTDTELKLACPSKNFTDTDLKLTCPGKN